MSSQQLCAACSRATKPLLEAAGAGHPSCIVQCLKVRGRFDLSIRDDFGATAVHLAARKGRLEALRYLVEYGEAVEPLRANNGASPAHDAAATGNLGCLHYLVAHTASSAHDRDNNRATPIHWAAQMGHLTVVQWLVEEAGAPLDVKTKSGVTPIHFAAAKNQLEVLKYLTSLHVPNMRELVNARAGNGATPVYFAAQDGHLRCVAWLVERARCDCKIRANDGMTCLHAAAQEGHLDCVRYLVTNGCLSVRTESADGATAAHFAAAQGHLHILQWLVESGGASGCETDNYGGTPAHDAAEQGQLRVLELLYQQEIDINVKDNEGTTPEVLAERNGHRDCCEFLIEATQKQEERKRLQLPESIQPRRDRNRRGSTKSIRLQDWVEETKQEEEWRQLERTGSNRARSPVSPEPHFLNADAKKQWEELQRLIAEEERQARQMGSSNQRRWAEQEQLRIADAARERQKRRELEASLRTARIEVERSEKRLLEEQEFLMQQGELFPTQEPMSAAELEKLKKDEEKRRQYREMREAEEEEASKKHRAEERRKREALEKQRAEEERQRILTERQNQWLHDMQKQNEQQRRTQEQTQEQGRRKMEEQEKRKQEEEKARERRKQEEVERKKNKKEEEQRRKRQKKEEKEREKSQKEREKHMKKLEKERRQNWEVTSVNSDSAYRSHDQTPEPHRIGLSRANTVSATEQLRVKGLVSLRTKEFERRNSENIRHTERQGRGVFKWILRSNTTKPQRRNVTRTRESNASVPVPPPVPKELGSATPSPSLTPTVSTEKLSSQKPSSRSSSRRSSLVELLFPSKESKEKKKGSDPSTPHSQSCSDTETASPAHSQSHSRNPSLSDVQAGLQAPVERKLPEFIVSSTNNKKKSLKEALASHSQMEKSKGNTSKGNTSQSTAKSQPTRQTADLEKQQPHSNASSQRKPPPSLRDALASSRAPMEKLSPKSSLNTLDLLSVKDSSPAAMMAALERALAASPSQPRAAFQTSADTTLPAAADSDNRDLMLELATSAKSGQARHFEDNELEDILSSIQNQTQILVPLVVGSLDMTTTELDSVYHSVPTAPPIPDLSGNGSHRHSTLETINEDDEPEEVQDEQLNETKLKKYADLLHSFEINRKRALQSRALKAWCNFRNRNLSRRARQQRADAVNSRRLLQRTFTAWCKHFGTVDETMGKQESHRSNVVRTLNEKMFLAWLNSRLAHINQKVDNLEGAIASGVPILMALHVASKVAIPKHVAKPRYRVQFQDNWATVINFMRQLRIPTTNLNSEDLYRQQQNAIHKMLANIVSWSQNSR